MKLAAVLLLALVASAAAQTNTTADAATTAVASPAPADAATAAAPVTATDDAADAAEAAADATTDPAEDAADAAEEATDDAAAAATAAVTASPSPAPAADAAAAAPAAAPTTDAAAATPAAAPAAAPVAAAAAATTAAAPAGRTSSAAAPPASFQAPAGQINATPVYYPDVTSALSANPQLYQLQKALREAGLTAAVNSATGTIFAPRNGAFKGNKLTGKDLEDLLKYHVVPGAALKADRLVTLAAADGGSREFNTLLTGAAVEVTTTAAKGAAKAGRRLMQSVEAGSVVGPEEFLPAGSLSVNGAPVQRANIITKGAVIHVIDELLVPPPAAKRTVKAKPITAAEAEDKTRLGAADLASVAPKSTPAASSASAVAFTAAAMVAAPLAMVLAL